MKNTAVNRRQFIQGAGVAALGLGLSSETNALRGGPSETDSELENSQNGIPILSEDYQVIQRDSDDKGTCRVRIPNQQKATTFNIRITDETGRIWMDRELRVESSKTNEKEVLVEGISTGGPYYVQLSARSGDKYSEPLIAFRHILVGDIWILAGQSNMFGIALALEPLPALPYLNMLNNYMFDANSHWCAGIPPISRVPDKQATNEYRVQYPGITDEQIKQLVDVKAPLGGIGPEYFFAKTLYESGSTVPLGVIPVAVGAALAHWDPSKRDKNRYGFLYQQVVRAGGRVKGMLWYQGEQDAIFGDRQQTVTKPSLIYPTSTYSEQYKTFIEALRTDFHNPELVVILAQICRHHNGEKSRYPFWEQIREAQRLIPDQIPRIHTVPTVDLDLLDGLHLDYWSQKRLGRRMAYVALPYVKRDVTPRTEIKLKSVRFREKPRPAIIVEFDGVNGSLRAPGRPTGFQLRNKTTGEDVDGIFKVEFDREQPAAAILSLPRNSSTQNLLLVYAAGTVPYVNILDENDMAVPAFGPVEIAQQAQQ